MTKKRRNELNKIIRDARHELYVEETAERIKENTKQIGKCYCYTNEYGDGQWPVFMLVTRIDEHGDLYGITIEHTSMDEIRFEFNQSAWWAQDEDSVQISRQVFDEHYTRLVALLKRRQTAALKIQESPR